MTVSLSRLLTFYGDQEGEKLLYSMIKVEFPGEIALVSSFGADAGLTIGAIGQGAEISTTTNAGFDVLAFANSKIGLFGGAALEGAALVRRVDMNVAYYGRGATPLNILYKGQFDNPHADALRAALTGP